MNPCEVYVQAVDGAGHCQLRRNLAKADVVTANRAAEVVVTDALLRVSLLCCTSDQQFYNKV